MRNRPMAHTAAVINLLISLRIKAARDLSWEEIQVLVVRLKRNSKSRG